MRDAAVGPVVDSRRPPGAVHAHRMVATVSATTTATNATRTRKLRVSIQRRIGLDVEDQNGCASHHSLRFDSRVE
jgi:hypothetical protein